MCRYSFLECCKRIPNLYVKLAQVQGDPISNAHYNDTKSSIYHKILKK